MIVYLAYEDMSEGYPVDGVVFTAHETENLACIWCVEEAHKNLESYREAADRHPGVYGEVPDVLMHRIVEGENGSYCEVKFYYEDDDPDEPGGFCTFVIERLPLNEVEVDADSC